MEILLALLLPGLRWTGVTKLNPENQAVLDKLLAIQANLRDLLAVEDFLEDMEDYVLQQGNLRPETLENVRAALQEARYGALEAERAEREARSHWDSVRPRGANYGL